MVGRRIGGDLRLLRVRRRWRQEDLAERVGGSQSEISRVERGLIDAVALGRLEAIAEALGGRLVMSVLWHGERLDRVRDQRHAALVETLIERLVANRWNALPEVSFSVFGERGSIDILAFHPVTAMLLVVEVKTAFGDVQDTLSTIDRKQRLALGIARERGWRARVVSVLLAVAESSTNRRVVARHGAMFTSAFPVRGRAASRRIASPAPEAFRGLQFLSPSHGVTASRVERVHRARRRRPSSERTHE